MKYFFITGETSGDYIASVVVRDLLSIDQDATIQVWGGDALRDTGSDIKLDISELNIMGFSQVLRGLPRLFSLIKKAKTQIKALNPDVVVLVDFAGFNLRIATWAKHQGYKIVYIAPPKTWASRESRNQALKSNVDKVIVLFPFEKEYFLSKGISTSYYGHPLRERLEVLKSTSIIRLKYELDDRPIALLAPGSRLQEIKTILPILSELSKPFPQFNWIVSCAPSIKKEILQSYIPKYLRSDLTIVTESLSQTLMETSYAVIASGTATYEAALLKVPQIAVYRTGHLNYWLAKHLIRTKYISLVNLIMDKEVITELIQYDMHICNLKDEMRLLIDSEYNTELISKYEELHRIITPEENFNQTAQTIFQLARKLD